MKWLVTFALAFSISQAQRPQEHWVFRGVMRDKGRIIFLALNDNLSVAYQTSSCGLYMTWDGGMEDSYNTYTHQDQGNHGASIDPRGNILHWQHTENNVSSSPLSDNRGRTHTTKNIPGEPVWSISGGSVETDYRGYRLLNGGNVATLLYNLITGANVISVEETPEYSSAGGISLVRKFNIAGLPAGSTLSLKLTGSNVNGQSENWTATGSGTISNGTVNFTTNGETIVTGEW